MLDALAVGLKRKPNWVLDADIHGFFDTIDQGWLMKLHSGTGSEIGAFCA